VAVGGVCDHLEKPQNGGVRRLIKVRHALIHAIHRERILDQVVGADAEKIDFARQPFGAHGRARDFNHGADFGFRIELLTFAFQFRFALFEDGQGAAQFLEPRDHRKHDLHVPHRARPDDGSQLRFENVNPLERKADGAVTQERIHLIARIERARHLVATQIESADDERMRPHLLRDFPVSGVLFLLAWKLRLR